MLFQYNTLYTYTIHAPGTHWIRENQWASVFVETGWKKRGVISYMLDNSIAIPSGHLCNAINPRNLPIQPYWRSYSKYWLLTFVIFNATKDPASTIWEQRAFCIALYNNVIRCVGNVPTFEYLTLHLPAEAHLRPRRPAQKTRCVCSITQSATHLITAVFAPHCSYSVSWTHIVCDS